MSGEVIGNGKARIEELLLKRFRDKKGYTVPTNAVYLFLFF